MPRNVEQVEHFIGRFRKSDSLQLSGGATLAVLEIGPVSAGDRWRIDRVSVIDEGENLPSEAFLYVNSRTPDSFVGEAASTTSGGMSYACQPITLEAGDSLIVRALVAANEMVGVNIGYDLFEIEERPWGPQLPSADTSGFPGVPLQGDDAAGSQNRPDESDLLDRDPLGAACSSCGSPGCSGNCRRHALDGGIVSAFPADPSTPSGSDLF